MIKKGLYLLFFIGTLSCNNETTDQPTTDALASSAVDEGRGNLLSAYPQVPETPTILKAGDSGLAVYNICLQRYENALTQLKNEADALGAKLIVTILSPEIGDAVTISTQKGIPAIIDVSKKLGLDVYDLMNPLTSYAGQKITQMPLDGHWSVTGSKIIADLYQPLLAKYTTHKATKTFTDAERTTTFGDLEPEQNVALDGGKNLPYQLITNKQGLRMDQDISFPKAKQRILFIGDSQLYSPFLDNNQIFTALLQQKFPDAEMMNAGLIGYTLDDQVTLIAEKAKYAEPDVIVLVTNPNDIGDFFFSQRNKMSRSKKAYNPVSTEIVLYQQLYKPE